MLALDTAAVAALMYLWFLAAWGLNYRREPLRTLLDFQEDRITRESLHALALRDVDSLNALYAVAGAGRWPELADLTPVLDPAFERAYRVQMNTLESTVMFLPTLWLAANYGFSGWAGVAELRAISNAAADRDMRPENIRLALQALKTFWEAHRKFLA